MLTESWLAPAVVALGLLDGLPAPDLEVVSLYRFSMERFDHVTAFAADAAPDHLELLVEYTRSQLRFNADLAVTCEVHRRLGHAEWLSFARCARLGEDAEMVRKLRAEVLALVRAGTRRPEWSPPACRLGSHRSTKLHQPFVDNASDLTKTVEYRNPVRRVQPPSTST
jgi:hypothetical protein